MEEKWINKFQTKFQDFPSKEPEGLWDDIDKALDQEMPAPMPARKRASIIPLWTRITAAVAAIAAALLLLVNLQTKHGEALDGADRLTATSTPSAPAQEFNPAQDIATTTAPESATRAASQHHVKGTAATAPHSLTVPVAIAENAVKGKIAAETLEPTPDEHQSPATTDHETAEKRQPSQPVTATATEKRYPQRPNIQASSKKSSGLAVNLFASNVSTGASRAGGVASMKNSVVVPGEASALNNSPSMFHTDWVRLDNLKPWIEMDHHQPIRFGIALNYGLTDRLNLGTGIVYSRHSSSVYSVLMSRTLTGEQHLHYLGIPVSVDYLLWKHSDFGVYVSGGMMAEKCISGEMVDLDTNEPTTVKEKALQFSVNGAVGAQYNLNRNVGIYVEPGVVYYIDNGSNVDNIYKDKPLNFNLELGLRLTIK